LDLVPDWVRLVIALDKDVQVESEITYEHIYSVNQTYKAMTMCILKDKVINQYLSYISFFPLSEIMPIYSTLGPSSEHFQWNL